MLVAYDHMMETAPRTPLSLVQLVATRERVLKVVLLHHYKYYSRCCCHSDRLLAVQLLHFQLSAFIITILQSPWRTSFSNSLP